jgi:surfeit locus 1 family protein
VALLATLAGVLATGSLGVWQLGRASEKLAMQAALDARALLPPIEAPALASSPDEAGAQHYRQVRLRGHWLAQRTVFLDNRALGGRAGFVVVTPLQFDDSRDAVLVQRGWTPRDASNRSMLPRLPLPTGSVDIEGWVAPPPARLYEFSSAAGGAIRQNLDIAEFAHETGLSLRPLSVQQGDSPATVGDGLLRQWPRPAVDVHKNYGYAVQWFALAALMAGLYVWFQLVRPRLKRRA